MLVFSSSKKEIEINKVINNGGVVSVPSQEVIESMGKAFDNTEASGKENGFRVGNKGSVSVVVEGSEGIIKNEDWQPTITNLKAKGEYVAYDVHTHPNEKDSNGDIINIGKPIPSSTDKENIAGNQPNVVLGYREQAGFKNPNKIGVTVPNVYIRQIGFFNPRGSITKPMDFSIFKNVVTKINKQ